MQDQFIPRKSEALLHDLLNEFPVLAILGPRQCGKSTLAKHFIQKRKPFVFLDLESPSDQRKLTDPETYFHMHEQSLVCLDEIQRIPALFEILRVSIDRNPRNGRYLILGSASRDLIRQSSETLAGRIAFIELTPFQFGEIPGAGGKTRLHLNNFWVRGGFPKSYLAPDDSASFRWRMQFIGTFLERDVPQLGFQIPAETLGRLWRMTAHVHGQVLNASKIGESLGQSHVTIRNHLGILAGTFLVRLLPPFEVNLKKRMIKSPKAYIRDSGLLHALLEIETMEELIGHPSYGSSWEGMALEAVLQLCPDWRSGFFRTSAGAEIDLVLERKKSRICVEFKASSNPQVTRGFWNALDDLKPVETWIVSPVDEVYPIRNDVHVIPLWEIQNRLKMLTK